MSLLDRIGKGGAGGEQGEGRTSQLEEMRVKAPQAKGVPQGPNQYKDLKTRIQNKLLNEIDPSTDPNSPNVRAQIQQLFETILAEEGLILSNKDKRSLFENIIAEILGLGPLEILMKEDAISEVMINGPKNIFIEMKGVVKRANITFESDEHVMRVIDRIVSPLGRRVDESHPFEDARLPDGSRVNVIIPPLALNGPTLTIRKFSKKPLTIEDLIKYGSMTPEMAEFLRATVIAAVNVVVSGGTGSGKTTLLNVLSNFIPSDERVITVENAAELQLQGEHVVTLESRPANIEGKGAVSIQDLVINCLRMRPDRIVVGECRGGEALDMLQAMNTGHEGSLTTAHSNSPRDTIARLEVMCLMAGMDLPQRAIREQIASAIDMICHQSRLRDGSRKIVKVTEIQGMEGDVITMSDIFEFEQTGVEAGKVIGRIRPTGLRPKFIDRIAAAGIHLQPSVFGIGKIRH